MEIPVAFGFVGFVLVVVGLAVLAVNMSDKYIRKIKISVFHWFAPAVLLVLGLSLWSMTGFYFEKFFWVVILVFGVSLISGIGNNLLKDWMAKK